MYSSLQHIGVLVIASASTSTALVSSQGSAAPSQATSKSVSNEAEELEQAYTALYHKGDYEAAIPLAQRACDLLNEVTGEGSLEHTKCLGNLATLFGEKGDFDRSEAEFKKALKLRISTLGPDHFETAKIMNNLGLLHMNQGDYTQAEDVLNQALAIYKKDDTKQHHMVMTLGNLAVLHTRAGNFAKAEQMHRDSLEVRLNLFGPDHPDIGFTLHNLGGLLLSQGEYAEAEKLYKQALDIYSKKLPSDHIEIAMTMGDLGMVFLEQERYMEAQAALTESLSIKKRKLPSSHLQIAQSINNLGMLEWKQGRFAEAAMFYRQALAISEDVLGPDHLDTVHIMNNLGMVSLTQGDLDTAKPLLERGIATFEDVLGPTHPRLAQSILSMSLLQFKAGDHGSAAHMYRRALDIEEVNVSRALVIADDRRRLAYTSKLFISSHHIISLHLQHAPHNDSFAEIALTTLLRRKGRVQDLVAQSYISLRRSLPRDRMHLLDDLGKIQSQYAAITSQEPIKGTSDKRRARLEALEKEEDSLWAALAKSSSQARALTKAVTISDVQAKLPGDSILIEFVKYISMDGVTLSRKNGKKRYAAYIVFPDHFDWIDLGPAEPIEDCIRSFRNSIARREDATSSSRTLYDSVMRPVVNRADFANRLFISPDGDLSLVPFEALVDEYSNYLVARYHLHYLTSGRDLLRPSVLSPNSSERGVVLVANPRGADLPGTEQEAQTLSTLFGNVATKRRDDATEASLRDHPHPRILHLATHGSFGSAPVDQTHGTRQSYEISSENQSSFRLDNPMLHSWLELATPAILPGGQSEDFSTDDGRLTAYEISGWDLRGTELVTLSACDTAQGTYQQGEGILGLRRAFAIAGAQTQVMSLWKVSDTATAKLMESYYRRLLAGEGRSEAMRNTQLELLRDPATRHPRDWAAFVVVGEWGPLSRIEPPVKADPEPIESRPRGCQATVAAPSDLASATFVLLPLLACARRRRTSIRRRH